ncbi:hypothetical protein GCM10007028_27240 [Algibacter mikhailovii]|uniref:Uncharacterized protein n=1 Tax=Algibacter mikhailovii TaxID=425498 RepID=A0A918VCG5_9FLAO|nr:hypothetical protein GCM10007028_27240 [Algibacter mikhailovii]
MFFWQLKEEAQGMNNIELCIEVKRRVNILVGLNNLIMIGLIQVTFKLKTLFKSINFKVHNLMQMQAVIPNQIKKPMI